MKIMTIQKMTLRQEPQPSSRNSNITPSPFRSHPNTPPKANTIRTSIPIPIIVSIPILFLTSFQFMNNMIDDCLGAL